MRAVIYARYSSILQRDASIEDQLRLCRERTEREGWTLHASYTNHAMSGASPRRCWATSLKTTQRHYDQSRMIASGRRYQREMLALLRRRLCTRGRRGSTRRTGQRPQIE